MKNIISRAIPAAIFSAIILIIAYVVEEVLEDAVSEAASDLVFPVAGLFILGLIWIYLVPTIQAHLKKDEVEVKHIVTDVDQSS
jgi:hypothetical protein